MKIQEQKIWPQVQNQAPSQEASINSSKPTRKIKSSSPEIGTGADSSVASAQMQQMGFTAALSQAAQRNDSFVQEQDSARSSEAKANEAYSQGKSPLLASSGESLQKSLISEAGKGLPSSLDLGKVDQGISQVEDGSLDSLTGSSNEEFKATREDGKRQVSSQDLAALTNPLKTAFQGGSSLDGGALGGLKSAAGPAASVRKPTAQKPDSERHSSGPLAGQFFGQQMGLEQFLGSGLAVPQQKGLHADSLSKNKVQGSSVDPRQSAIGMPALGMMDLSALQSHAASSGVGFSQGVMPLGSAEYFSSEESGDYSGLTSLEDTAAALSPGEARSRRLSSLPPGVEGFGSRNQSGQDYLDTVSALQSSLKIPLEKSKIKGALKEHELMPEQMRAALGAESLQDVSASHPGQMKEILGHVTSGAGAKSRLSTQSLIHIGQEVQNLARSGGGEIRVRLKPDDLGELNIRIIAQGSKIGLHFQTSSEASQRLIQDSMSYLKDSLHSQKLSLGQVDFSMIPSQAQSDTELNMADQQAFSQFGPQQDDQSGSHGSHHSHRQAQEGLLDSWLGQGKSGDWQNSNTQNTQGLVDFAGSPISAKSARGSSAGLVTPSRFARPETSAGRIDVRA